MDLPSLLYPLMVLTVPCIWVLFGAIALRLACSLIGEKPPPLSSALGVTLLVNVCQFLTGTFFLSIFSKPFVRDMQLPEFLGFAAAFGSVFLVPVPLYCAVLRIRSGRAFLVSGLGFTVLLLGLFSVSWLFEWAVDRGL